MRLYSCSLLPTDHQLVALVTGRGGCGLDHCWLPVAIRHMGGIASDMLQSQGRQHLLTVVRVLGPKYAVRMALLRREDLLNEAMRVSARPRDEILAGVHLSQATSCRGSGPRGPQINGVLPNRELPSTATSLPKLLGFGCSWHRCDRKIEPYMSTFPLHDHIAGAPKELS